MDMRFAATSPKDCEFEWCGTCMDNTGQTIGIAVDKWGIYAARMCTRCGDIHVGPESNPLEEINRKLDKLLAWAGME